MLLVTKSFNKTYQTEDKKKGMDTEAVDYRPKKKCF